MHTTRIILLSVALGLVACGHAAPPPRTAEAPLPPEPCMDDAPIPGLSPRPFRHEHHSSFIRHMGSARHRGRDRFVRPGDPQIVLAKFAYGMTDKDLEDEEIDVFVRRACAGEWEKLGVATTTQDENRHPPVDGVEDRGGQIFYEIPAEKALAPGRHQLRLVVGGDLTSTDVLFEVVSPGTKIFVSDVDGTLTSSENIEMLKVLEGTLPDAHPGAADAFRILVEKGYHPMYLTARPELLVPRTRAFLRAHGFPLGVVHTSPATFGAGMGASAASFKKTELQALAALGLVPSFGFGNMPSDSDAYAAAGIDPTRRFFYRIDGKFEGRRIESYDELWEPFRALPSLGTP